MEPTCPTACVAERQADGFCGEAQEAQAEIARLRAERDDAHHALWCAARQHGGRLYIGQRAAMDHRHGASRVTVTTLADGLSLEIRAD